ncbi:MAG: hypothetical protein ISS52_04405 [Dehalococcoidia bacterium]|nr:hypothetical protein [Dehalococcoidia bacterium]
MLQIRTKRKNSSHPLQRRDQSSPQGHRYPYTVKCNTRHMPCQIGVGTDKVGREIDKFPVTGDKFLVASCLVPGEIACHSKNKELYVYWRRGGKQQ